MSTQEEYQSYLRKNTAVFSESIPNTYTDPVKDTAVDFTKSQDLSYLELGRVTRLNSGLILRSACYSAGFGLVLSPKISLKLGRVL